jgi:hypothetical protein|tara:strand:- start:304 stop:564 length:261 start_codon:yes stop_codon:yes gene_type:complete
MKLNTNISIENIITIIALVCSVTLAFGFMQYDIDSIKRDLELKVDKKEVAADRNLITYKLDVITAEIEEMKVSLKEIKGEIHGLRK